MHYSLLTNNRKPHRRERFWMTVLLALLGPCAIASQPAITHRVYSHLLEPQEHPDYLRRSVKPPTWDTFQHRTQFTCLRGFNLKDDRIVDYREEIEKFTQRHRLGRVLWPSYPILFARNLSDLAEEIRRQGLYLFDVWGYVPGSGPGGYWQQFKPSTNTFVLLEATLGERWLGTDIGEQDGRYVGGYANQLIPASASRFEQYLNFQRHFERMGNDLGNKHATLVSLNFGHYLLKEGTYTLIGAETAQGLPNNQVYYAFIRGAGKQYGVPWFGNASIYNRWGFKTYGSAGKSDGYDHGPTKGTSLSLLKRLLYTHILYNSMAVGFENGWFEGDQLSPIGRIQQAAQRWVDENGQPGVLYTPVALLLDFPAGWTFPRHLYTDQLYRVWGNLPYGSGDFLTDAILDLLYPGYQNSSYYRDESGFLTPTPYGDIADCLLSDAPGWLLARYPVVVVAGELTGSRELNDKLQAYVEAGGHLVLSAGNLARLPHGIAGHPQSTTNTTVTCGQGKLSVFTSDFGVTIDPRLEPTLANGVDRPLPKPYSFRPDARQNLDAIFRQQPLFTPGSPELSLTTCRKGPGKYTLGIANNSWRELPLNIASRCGPIQSLRELILDQSEKTAIGYLPEGVNGQTIGASTDHTIAGGDIRLYDVQVNETGVSEIPHVPPPARPKGRVLPLRSISTIKEEILKRPEFFEHFDGIVVDWRYLHDRESMALQQEGGWIRRQGLRVYVDASSGLNLYPDLRLIDNDTAEFGASLTALETVLKKMELLASQDLIFSLHRHPENNFSPEQTQAAFERTLKTLSARAATCQVTLHLRLAFGKPPSSLSEASNLLDKIGAHNLRLAVNTALLPPFTDSQTLTKELRLKLGLWLAAAPRSDLADQKWDTHAHLHQSPSIKSVLQWIALSPQTPVVFDAICRTQDEEYLEATTLRP